MILLILDQFCFYSLFRSKITYNITKLNAWRNFMLDGLATKRIKALLATGSSFPGFELVSQFTESSFCLRNLPEEC